MSLFVVLDDLSRAGLLKLWDSCDDIDGKEFDDEPFVIAANEFTTKQYSKLIELLTQAINEGI